MSLVATLMQPIRTQYRDRGIDKLEQRRSIYGAWNYFQQESTGPNSLIDEDLRAKIKQSFGKTIQIPVFNTEDVVITNVRACTVPDLQNTTALVTLTFVTYAFGFTMIPSEYFNNDIKYERDFTRKLERFIQKLAATLETASANNLSTNKNTYWPAKISAYYPVVANALQITQAQKNDFYNTAKTVMQEMDFNPGVDVVTTLSGQPMLNRLQNQGPGNAVNEQFQFNGYNWYYSNGITNGAGVQSTGYMIQPGTVGVENRNDPDAIMRSRIDGVKEWDEVDVPLVNLRMASYYYADCADVSAYHAGMTNLTRVKKEGFEWSTDICFVNAYNSDPTTRFNPIVKFEISAS